MRLRIARLIRNLVRRDRIDCDLDAEIRAHLEMLVEEKIAAGISEREARREARIELGGIDQVKENVREVRMGAMIEQLGHDVHYGLRMMRKNPGFALLSVVALALGIGVNTAIFSFTDALLFRSLPVKEPSRLAVLFHVGTKNPENFSSFSFPDYTDFRDQNSAFSGLAASSTIDLDLSMEGETERIHGEIVSGNYFSVLGVEPARGRTFLPEEDQTPGTHPVAVISYGFWQRRLGADPNVIGKMLTLNGRGFTVIGIAPKNFRSLDVRSSPEIWVPLMMHSVAMPTFKMFGTELFGNRGTHWLDLVGRLEPGISLQQAETALRTIAQRQEQAYRDTNLGWSVATVPVNEARFGSPTSGSFVSLGMLLLSVAGLVLLVACANVANLLLAKAVSRQKEMGIRLALGAGRARLVRQLMTESVLLALLGGAAGLLLAVWTADLLRAFEVFAMLPALDVRLDGRVLCFALVISFLTGTLFGLVPAFHAARTSVAETLKGQGVSTSDGLSRPRLRHGLVTFQVALCMVLLVSAGLLLRTMRNFYGLDLGFTKNNLLLTTIDLSSRDYSETQGRLFFRQLMERVRALPGVESASLTFTTPFGGMRMANDVFTEGGENPSVQKRINVDMNVVDVDHFRTMQIPLVRGRDFTEQDQPGSPGVAIVNETMARRVWPGEDPVGKRIRLWDPRGQGELLEVVGLVKDGRYYRSWRDRTRPFMFLPFLQQYRSSMALQIRMNGPAGQIAAAVRSEVQALDKSLPLFAFTSVNEAMNDSIVLERMGAGLLSVFSFLALVLTAIGIYGAISFTVSQRTREIGIRMALGARLSDIVGLVVGQSVNSILAGVAIGWAAAFGLTRLMSSLLFGVRSTDFETFAVVSCVMIVAGLLASYVPARRAARVDPMIALRCE